MKTVRSRVLAPLLVLALAPAAGAASSAAPSAGAGGGTALASGADAGEQASGRAAATAGRQDATQQPKPRTIVTTDPELDDLNSLIRLLLYSNEIDIAGLVYASSQHHYAGDRSSGTAAKRWKRGQSHIEDVLVAYARVQDNLRSHDPAYPTVEELRSKYRVGNVKILHDISESTPGSRLIADVLLDDDPRPVFLQAWGGISTIARGLRDIEERYKNTPRWNSIYQKVTKKAIITRYGAQDNTYDTYIQPNWPQIENREVATAIYGYDTRTTILPEDRHLVESAWTRRNVSRVGPLGALYRVWGDGKFMAEFAGPRWEPAAQASRGEVPCTCHDNEDYFGFDSTKLENSVPALTARGYVVWTTALEPTSPLHEPGAFISEGDSSAFALLIGNGLRSHESATYGGWGGRQVKSASNPHLYSSPSPEADDINPSTGTVQRGFHAARWWRAIQSDFANRLRWSVTHRRANANHEPIASVASEKLNITVRPGQRVRLTGRATDPDGQRVASKWWYYPEAGTYTGGVVAVTNVGTAGAPRGQLVVPADAKRGQTLHFILEVTDRGTPALTSYQRVIATVR